MKTKLMFAVLAAAAVFTACTKEGPTMDASKTLKSVEISLDNLIYTKGAAGDKIEAVHMLPGYTHNIINLSDTEDLVTLMWANESFDPTRPDTYFEPVE